MHLHAVDKRIEVKHELTDLPSPLMAHLAEGTLIQDVLPETLRQNLWSSIATKGMEEAYYLGCIQNNTFIAKDNFSPLAEVPDLIPFITQIACAMRDKRVDTLSFGIFLNFTKINFAKSQFRLGDCLYSLGDVAHAMLSFSEQDGALEWIVPNNLSQRDLSKMIEENPDKQDRYYQNNIAKTGPRDLLIMKSHFEGHDDYVCKGVRRRIQKGTAHKPNITMMWLPKVKP